MEGIQTEWSACSLKYLSKIEIDEDRGDGIYKNETSASEAEFIDRILGYHLHPDVKRYIELGKIYSGKYMIVEHTDFEFVYSTCTRCGRRYVVDMVLAGKPPSQFGKIEYNQSSCLFCQPNFTS
ncbi:MAG: hypothetical protein QME40_03250 [bacterium]|nr:hypothetical protein [bacterium]